MKRITIHYFLFTSVCLFCVLELATLGCSKE